ncbi:MAG: hypothetical protein J7J94_04775 [Thaumarchaeota archaeon]|nr:hypothetical protein [Nitrososphaerota archaeon]
MSGEESKTLKLEVSSIEELAFLASNLHFSILNLDEEKKIAFTFLTPAASLNPIVYFCRLKDLPKGRFVHVNRLTGKVKFSDEVSAEPNEVSILIVKVKSGNLLLP